MCKTYKIIHHRVSLESKKYYGNDLIFSDPIVISPPNLYRIPERVMPRSRAVITYARANANPNALAYGLGTLFLARTSDRILTKLRSASTLHILPGLTVDACHPLRRHGIVFEAIHVLSGKDSLHSLFNLAVNIALRVTRFDRLSFIKLLLAARKCDFKL